MGTEQSRQVVAEYLAAQAKGDFARMQELLAEDVEWVPPGSVGIEGARGRDAVLAALGSAGARFFDLATMKADVKKLLADGDDVVLRMSATAKAANGRDYSNEYVWIYTVRDGRIARMEEHVDTLRFKQIVLD